MARVRVCGVCWKPVKECLCDDDEPQGSPRDDTDDEVA